MSTTTSSELGAARGREMSCPRNRATFFGPRLEMRVEVLAVRSLGHKLSTQQNNAAHSEGQPPSRESIQFDVCERPLLSEFNSELARTNPTRIAGSRFGSMTDNNGPRVQMVKVHRRNTLPPQ